MSKRGSHTPAKHELLNGVAGAVAGAATSATLGAQGLGFIDLCAGDAAPVTGDDGQDLDWWRSTSVGILIRHAQFFAERTSKNGRRLPACVDLYEINRNPYDKLIENLTDRIGEPLKIDPPLILPEGANAAKVFRHGDVLIRATLGSGKDADISWIDLNEAVFVNNDPYHVHDWAMRPTLVWEIRSKTWMCMTDSTMGCNVGGLLRLDYEERQMWYRQVQATKESLPHWHDLMLAAVDRDSSKWAYLLAVPGKWREQTEKQTRTAFQKIGRNMNIVWWRKDRAAFEQLEDVLFLRKSEREATEGGA